MPELTEPIESINNQLVDLFGVDTITGLPIFRIVWSNDQYEKRLTDCTDSGLQLLYPEVRELPKYKQWVQNKYVLERLVLVPNINQAELPSSKLSYEPIYVFQNGKGEYLPPKLIVAKIVIDTLYAALGKRSLAKYVQSTEEKIVEMNKELEEIYEYLYGDESGLLGDTINESGSTIINPWGGES